MLERWIARLRDALNRVDVNCDGKVDIEDALESFAFVMEDVEAGDRARWLVTVVGILVALVIGFFAGRFSA